MTTTLRSRDNARVRRWRALARDARLRREARSAWIEGPHLVAEYLRRVGAPRALVVSDGALEDPEIAALVRTAGLAPVVLAARVFDHVADARTPTGIGAEIVLPPPDRALPEGGDRVVLDGVQDPGNLGTILRSALGFGLDRVLLAPGCADPWSPRALRAGSGAQFALHLARPGDLPALLKAFRGIVACAVPRGGQAPDALDLRQPVAWLFGAEGAGVGADLRACATVQATVPMVRGTESLNVAAAATICFYEAARQRARPQ